MASTALLPSTDSSAGATETAIQALIENARGSSIPSTVQVSSAVAGLRAAVGEQKNALNAFMIGNHGLVSRQLQETQRLMEDSRAMHQAVESVGKDFDPHNPKDFTGIADFMKLAASRSSSTLDQALSVATLASIEDVQQQHEDLRSIEDAIWSGRSPEIVELDSFHVKATNARPKSLSKVGAAMQSRAAILRSTVTDQLARAWGSSVSVNVVASVPTILVRRKLRLQLPIISRATTTLRDSTSTPPSYQLSDIALAMSKLGILAENLQSLHAQIIHEVVDVLLSSSSTHTSISEENDSALARIQAGGPQSAEQTAQSVKAVLLFVRQTICSPAVPDTETFLLNLQKDTFARILTSLVIPSMPSTCDQLPEWMRLVRQCSALEAELTMETQAGVLSQFAEAGAQQKWLAKFRHARLQAIRNLSFNSWPSLPVKEVELPQISDSPKPTTATSLVATDDPMDGAGSTADGWDFDEVLKASQLTPAPPEGDEDSGGWDFDDDVDVKPQPKPEVNQPLPKPPVREAKRLGKRGLKTGDRNTRSSLSPSPSPPPPPPPSQPDPPAKPRLPREVAPQVAHHPSQPQRKVYRVSQACDAVLQLPSEIIKEVETMTRLGEATFQGVANGMTDILTEEMDFICAATAVAKQSNGTMPLAAALQLSNDYQYIGGRLAISDMDLLWPAKNDCAQKFMTASRLWRRISVEEQLVGLAAILDGARHFVEMSHDSFFQQAEEAIRSAISQLQSIADDTKSVLVSEQRLELLGNMVESVVIRLLGDVVALDDITEAESERISSILSLVETLDQLFLSPVGDVSSIAAHVPHWLKLCYLKEILHANLVDITYLFESGSLVDFEPAELSKLIQALFADSVKRSALLDKIGYVP